MVVCLVVYSIVRLLLLLITLVIIPLIMPLIFLHIVILIFIIIIICRQIFTRSIKDQRHRPILAAVIFFEEIECDGFIFARVNLDDDGAKRGEQLRALVN